ncbi:bifunctional AP-4-A phosphorylase/ADP sulfurylase [Sporothrix epigloea]|uniref:Bifunctional AP-4-A phosphorylase/ADP sulfurylase n=1 Tax=Sporothrix epigloea TaxID=1892477 RepID=A0ABP0DCM8_9PEZI
MAPPLGIPAGLPHLVHDAFLRAKTAGDLSFFPTQVALLRVHGVPFQLRFAPSLANKPKSAGDKTDKAKSKPFDPFADPPPGLLILPKVGDSGGSTHRLVLNKFAISQDHSILATSDFRPQTHLLEASDLAAAYACVEAYHQQGEELYVFYNSGANSGASQPHRHLQLLPVARIQEGLPKGSQFGEACGETTGGTLVDQLAWTSAELPIVVATVRLPDSSSVSASLLYETYLRLYRQGCAAAANTSAMIDAGETVDTTAEERGTIPARMSYNLALTRKSMAIIPRAAEGSAVTPDGDMLSLNGTVLAGTALVKSEAEWDALRSDPSLLENVLLQIGVPLPTTVEKSSEVSKEDDKALL